MSSPAQNLRRIPAPLLLAAGVITLLTALCRRQRTTRVNQVNELNN
jgi:hypothetical protein